MGTCESNIKEKKEKRVIKLKKGICLFIKKNINPIIYYHYFYINNKYVPFLITSINSTKDENDRILLYEKDYMISLHKLKRKIEYEKYGYIFFEFQETLIPKIPSFFSINNKILLNEKDEASIGNYAYLLYKSNNSKDYTKHRIKITGKNNITFEYKCVDDNEIISYYNLIEDSESNIIGVKLENKCGILFKPLFKEFLELSENKYYDIKNNNSIQNLNNMINNTNINKNYIIPLFLALANIEKLKDINNNSFEIEENDIIYYIIKIMEFYNRNEILKAKQFINEFANLYNEENINFKKLIDFISYKSYLKFQIDTILKDNFVQNQNIIQKKLFIIYKNEEKCNDTNKQYICNSMYLYSENKECVNLQKLIYEWENEEKERCSKCLNKHFIKRKIIYWPEILIIILNDKNKIKDIDELKIQQYQTEYKLKCCIGELSEINNFNVFYKEQNKWYMIKNDDYFTKIEVKNKINPCALFYEKIYNKENYSFGNQNYDRNSFNSNNNNSNCENSNLNIENENKNILKKNTSFSSKNPNLIIDYSNKSNNPTSNAPLNKNIFPNTINADKYYNHPSNTHLNISNYLYPIRYNNLQYPSNNAISNIKHIPLLVNNGNAKNNENKKNYYNNLYYNNSNSNNHRSITPTPIPNNKDFQANQNLNNNKIIITNKNNVNAPKLNNNKKSTYHANYNSNIKSYGENNKEPLIEYNNNFDINNINLNIKNDYIKINKNNIIHDDENEKEISLYFIFKNGKELYLDVKKSWTFLGVITQLEDKYLWLKDNIKIREFQFKGKAISANLTVKNIGLEDESIIKIIESD